MNETDVGRLCHCTKRVDRLYISKNLVQHSRTKYIDIRYHFIMELVEQQMVLIEYVPTQKQLANIFTKPLDATRFEELWKILGLCCVKLVYNNFSYYLFLSKKEKQKNG
jgi:hypothetical protein